MQDNVNVLDEINKGSSMGTDAVDFVLKKVEDKKLKKVLEDLHKKYENIIRRINKIYNKYNKDKTPHETNMMNKVMTWYGVEMKTFNDTSNSKIAELILQGINMGIIEGKKIYNSKKMDMKVKSIVKEYINMQEEYVEILKKFL